MFATIGYEGAKQEDLISTLVDTGIEVLIDVRDRAQSRKAGFSKTALRQAVNEAGLDYIHLRELGDPKEGREAARAGQYEKFRRIYEEVLTGEAAQGALDEVLLIASSKNVCLMCYERVPEHCHRKIISDRIEDTLDAKVIHLGVVDGKNRVHAKRRVLYPDQGAAASI